MSNPVSFRFARPDDIPFIYSSWLRSFKHSSALGKSMRSSVFFENYREIIDHILASQHSHVAIACLPDDPNVILGYLVYEIVSTREYIFHYCFVKESFRRLGIASALIKSLGHIQNIIHTHKTNCLDGIIDVFTIITASHITYNPLLLYNRNNL